jgi:type IV pilus assembly protein PilN
MRLDINLATHPYEDARRFWFRWGGALVALGIVTLGLLFMVATGWVNASKDRKLMRQQQAEIGARDKEKATAQALMNLPRNSVTRDRSQFLNDLFYRKSFSWTKVFEDLEQVMPPGLHVVSIHPELGPDNDLQIKLTVAGESRSRAIELAQKMEGSEHFQQTHIDEESAQTGGIGTSANDLVQFQISALYIAGKDSGDSTRSAK